MGPYTGVLDGSAQASGALTKHRFVRLAGAQTVQAITASTQRAIGVVDTDVSAAEATAGKTVRVVIQGAPLVEAGAAVALGDRVMPDTTGRAITAVTAANVPCGIALKAATAAGELIPVLMTLGLPVI